MAARRPAEIQAGRGGHADIKQTQRYLNVTDEELRQRLAVTWERRRLRAVGE